MNTANERGCYCGLWRTNPRVLRRQGVPEGFCGFCQVCQAPGHARHFPGAVPFTGCWCDRHYRLVKFLHPAGSFGFFVWLVACCLLLAVLFWWLYAG